MALFLLTFIHGSVGEPIRVGVLLASDVFERHVADFMGQQAGCGVKGLEPGVFDLEASQHLLNEQERIGSHVNDVLVMSASPLECRQKAPILGDVIGGDAYRPAEFVDDRPVGLLDADAIAGRTGIPASAAVNVRDD